MSEIIRDYKVFTLPQPRGIPNSRYFVLRLDDGVDFYITDTFGNYKQVLNASVAPSLPVIGEIPVGLINGSNATYTSLNDFIPETLEVKLNGLSLTKTLDYNTIGNNTINFFISPLVGEKILINYIKL